MEPKNQAIEKDEASEANPPILGFQPFIFQGVHVSMLINPISHPISPGWPLQTSGQTQGATNSFV